MAIFSNIINADKLGGKDADYFANKSVFIAAIISASDWNGTETPYTNTVQIESATAENNLEVIVPADVTAEQIETFQSALIFNGTQAEGSITLNAWGEVPSIDLPIVVIVRGD